METSVYVLNKLTYYFPTQKGYLKILSLTELGNSQPPPEKNIRKCPNICKRLAAAGGFWVEYHLKFSMVLLELTIPWENWLGKTFERKLSKYMGLVSEKEEHHLQYHWCIREGFKVAVDQKRRAMGWLTDLLDTSRGLISPGWVTWRRVYDVKRPEIPDDTRYINDDASRHISHWSMYTTNILS